MTVDSSVSNRRFMETILIPSSETAGSIPIDVPYICPLIPNIFGIDGPVRSASIMPTRFPSATSFLAISDVTVDLPTPPLPLTIPITLPMWLYSFNFSLGITLQPPLEEHPSQFPLHSAAILTLPPKITTLLPIIPPAYLLCKNKTSH